MIFEWTRPADISAAAMSETVCFRHSVCVHFYLCPGSITAEYTLKCHEEKKTVSAQLTPDQQNTTGGKCATGTV